MDAAQGVQLAADEPEYVPAAHGEHVPALAYVPGVHGVHALDPEPDTEPDAHVRHDAALVPPDALYVPAGHELQLPEPALDHVPGPHGEHAVVEDE